MTEAQFQGLQDKAAVCEKLPERTKKISHMPEKLLGVDAAVFLLAPSIGRAAILCRKLEAVLSTVTESEEAQDLSTFFSVTQMAQLGVNEYQDMQNHFATESAKKEQLQTLHTDANFAVIEANRKGTSFILAPLKALSNTAEAQDRDCGVDKVSKDGSLIEVKHESKPKGPVSYTHLRAHET